MMDEPANGPDHELSRQAASIGFGQLDLGEAVEMDQAAFKSYLRSKRAAILETLEIMRDPQAMRAICDYESGKTKFHPLPVLDDDRG